MTVKARADVTVADIRDVSSATRYYLLQASTAATPAKPTVTPPPSPWTTTEPTYNAGDTSSLYTTDLTVFSDNTFMFSDVSLSTSYEAAKSAANAAASAQNNATRAQSTADMALANVTNFIKNPQFHGSNIDGTDNTAMDASDSNAGTLPAGAKTYGKNTGGYDCCADNVRIKAIPGHTYRVEIDSVPASDMPAGETEPFGLMFWKMSEDNPGISANQYSMSNTTPTTVTDWTHASYDLTYAGTEPWSVFRPAYRAQPSQRWLVTNFSCRDITEAKAAQDTANAANTIAGAAQSAADTAQTAADNANELASTAQATADNALANAQELIRNTTMRSDVSNPDGWPGNVALGASGAPSTPPTPFTTYAKVTGRDHLASWTLPNIPGRVLQFTIYAVADSTATNAMNFGVQYSDTGSQWHWDEAIMVTVAQGQAGWAKYVGTWTVPGVISNTSLPLPWLQIDGGSSDSGWYVTGLSIKDITEAAAAQSTADTAQTIASAAQSAASAAQSSADAAHDAATAAMNLANTAQTTADGKNRIITSVDEPSHTGLVAGDTWRQINNTTDRHVTAYKVWNGTAFVPDYMDLDSLAVAGSLSAKSANIQSLNSAIAAILKLDVGQLVASDATVDTAVINKLAVDIATVIKLDAGTITTGQLGADRIDVNNLVAKIATILNLDAGKITSGYVDAARIAANSITADKLLVGGGGDLSPNPTFDPSGPLLGTPHSWIPGNGGHSVQLTGRDNMFPASTAFPVTKGDTFYITCEAAHPSGTAPLKLGLWWTVNPSTATSIQPYSNKQLATDLGQSANDPDWHKYSATISVPTASDAVVTAALGCISMEAGLDGEETVEQNTWRIGNYHIYKVNDATLIADGCISTDKLVANAVTADKVDVGSLAAAMVTSGKFTTTSGNTGFNDSQGVYAGNASTGQLRLHAQSNGVGILDFTIGGSTIGEMNVYSGSQGTGVQLAVGNGNNFLGMYYTYSGLSYYALFEGTYLAATPAWLPSVPDGNKAIVLGDRYVMSGGKWVSREKSELVLTSGVSAAQSGLVQDGWSTVAYSYGYGLTENGSTITVNQPGTLYASYLFQFSGMSTVRRFVEIVRGSDGSTIARASSGGFEDRINAVAILHCEPGDMVKFNWYSADSVARTRNEIRAVLIPD